MTDSTAIYIVAPDTLTAEPNIVLPADCAFASGTLELPGTKESQARPEDIGNDLATNILVGIFILLFLLTFNKFINILPYIFGCLLKWKEVVHVEDSMQIRRSRNSIALLLVIPFCMLAAKYDFIPQLASSGYSPAGNIPATFVVLSGYIVIRTLCNLLGRTIPCKRSAFDVASSSSMTFFSSYTVLALAIAGIMSAADASSETIRIVLMYAMAAVYIVFLIRKFQIFKNSCSLLFTILYLCTLEILPTATLIAMVVFL